MQYPTPSLENVSVNGLCDMSKARVMAEVLPHCVALICRSQQRQQHMCIMCDHSPKLLCTRSTASESNYHSIQAGSSVFKGQPLAFEGLLMLLLKVLCSLTDCHMQKRWCLGMSIAHPLVGILKVFGEILKESAAPGLGS